MCRRRDAASPTRDIVVVVVVILRAIATGSLLRRVDLAVQVATTVARGTLALRSLMTRLKFTPQKICTRRDDALARDLIVRPAMFPSAVSNDY